MGKEKKDLYTKMHSDVIPSCLKKVEHCFREGKWMIGNGDKIYMVDFFWGRVYTDYIANQYCYIEQAHRDAILKGCPAFKTFGDKFMKEQQNWLKKRTALGQKYIC